MSKQKTFKSKYAIMTLLLSIILNGLRFFIKGLNIQIIPDEIGAFATAPFLAGLDWSGAVSNASYYGFGYNWIFFPLLKITDNYIVLYLGITAINFILCCSVSILIYYILTNEMKVPQGWFAVILGAFCTTFRHNTFGVANEYPVFIVVWVICFILLKLYDTKDEKKKNSWYTAALALVCTYGLTVHERMLALWLGITFAVVVLRFKFKYSFLNEKIYFPLLIGGYGLQRIVRRVVVSKLWLLAEGQTITNMTAISGKSFSFIKSWGTILATFDGMLTNLYQLALSSYGMAVIAIFVVLLGLFAKKNNEIGQMVQNVQNSYLIIFVYGITILIVVAGLTTKASGSVWEGYQTGVETAGYKTFFYLRYYQPCIGPAFAATCAILFKYPNVLKKYIKIALLATMLIFLYLCLEIFPKLKDSLYLSARGFSWTPIMTKWLKDTSNFKVQIFNVGFSFFLLLILISAIFYFHKKLCRNVWIMLIFLTLIKNASLSWGSGAEIGEITSLKAEAAYDFIQEIEDEMELPQRIYCYNLGDIYTYQFVLNHYSVIGEMPEESVESVILFAPLDISAQEDVTEYYYMQLDENEWVYIKGDKLISDLSSKYEFVSCREQD